MQIVEIDYALELLGDDKNVYYRASATLNGEESPEQAIDELRRWVHQQASVEEEVDKLTEKKRLLLREITYIKQKMKRASSAWQQIEAQWDKAKTFLEQHGLEVDVTVDFPIAPKFDFEEESGSTAHL